MNCFQFVASRLGLPAKTANEKTAFLKLVLLLGAELNPVTSGPPAEALLESLRVRVGADDPAYVTFARELQAAGVMK